MNSQRNVVYSKRRHALMGERIGVDIVNTLYDTAENIVIDSTEANDFEFLNAELLTAFAMEAPFDEEVFRNKRANALTEDVADAAFNTFKRKMSNMAQIAYPVIKQVYEKQGQQYENILIPITDGKRMFNIPVNLKAAYESEGKEVVKAFEKAIMLLTIDEAWKENLLLVTDFNHQTGILHKQVLVLMGSDHLVHQVLLIYLIIKDYNILLKAQIGRASCRERVSSPV